MNSNVNHNAYNHYIFVIHGTFNAPEDGKVKWYQAGSEFFNKVTDNINNLGLLNAKTKSFYWSGENDHSERLKAAKDLFLEFDTIINQNKNARIHAIAHSHGGNVLLQAIDIYKQKHDENKHLGNFVFLGTPFYRKQWIKSQYKWIRNFSKLLKNIIALPGLLLAILSIFFSGVLIYYIIVLIINYVTNYFMMLPLVTFIGWNPMLYPYWIKIILCFLFSLSILAVLIRKDREFNTNIYFNENKLQDQKLTFDPLPSLVISAKFLDEAFLLLASDSLLEAQIMPRIEATLHPEYEVIYSLPKWLSKWILNRIEGISLLAETDIKQDESEDCNDIGLVPIPINQQYEMVFESFYSTFIGLIYAAILPFWIVIEAFGFRSFRNRRLLAAINAISCGLPISIIKGARIEMYDDINIPTVFNEYQYNDVFLNLIHDNERYQFLNDDKKLEEMLREENSTWNNIKKLIPLLYKDYKNSFITEKNDNVLKQKCSNIDGYEKKIARIWFTYIERFREIGGSLDRTGTSEIYLNHSLYYLKDEVIGVISKFIVSGNI